MLSAKNVSLTIEGVSLLDDISMEIEAGEVVALVGPNGAGKSTLLRSLAGEQALTFGSIFLRGKELSAWDARARAQQLAVLPQKSVLNFPFTAREVVQLSRTPHETGNEIDNQIVEETLRYLDASYLADRIYTRLSGGEQQRIQLARVVAQIWQSAEENRFLLLDEPAASFDLAHQQMLAKVLRELSEKNIGILVVLHDLNMALACADKTAVLACGQLKAFGRTQEVLSPPLITEVFGVETRFLSDTEAGRSYVGLLN